MVYDQRDNRARLKRYVKDKSVLDVCSYVGGWSITSLMMGAKSATAVDQSEHALNFAMQSAEKNGVESRFSTIQDDCFDALKALKRKGRKYDVIVVDPPAFIKRRKDIKEDARLPAVKRPGYGASGRGRGTHFLFLLIPHELSRFADGRIPGLPPNWAARFSFWSAVDSPLIIPPT